jgi:hypothetical protein
MGKTKEQILNEKRTEQEINQMPTRLKIDRLMSLRDMAIMTMPSNSTFGEEQKWESIWTEDELFFLKGKILKIVGEL